MTNICDLQPCKPDCPERTETCHSTCPKWIEWELVKYLTYSSGQGRKQAGTDADSIMIELHIKSRRRRNLDRIRRGKRS